MRQSGGALGWFLEHLSVKISKSITHSLLNDEQLIGGAWIIILNLEANPVPSICPNRNFWTCRIKAAAMQCEWESGFQTNLATEVWAVGEKG